MSRRAQNRQDKRARILRAALSVFADAGYGGATMDAIALAADLSKPTLYQYFASKDALFVAMMQAPGQAMLTEIDVQRGDFVGQLHGFATRYAQTVMAPEYLSMARLIIGEAQRFPEIGQAYQAAGPDVVQAALTRFMQMQHTAGHINAPEPDLAAQDFWGLILSGPRNQALHRPDALPTPRQITRSLHNGLKVFLRAYSCDSSADLARLEEMLAVAPL